MKILYVGTERAEAQAIATAVNSPGERVTVQWTSGLDRVAKWIDENDGLRVLVVEAQPNGPVWRSVLTYAAGLPAALPVVVIVPEEVASDLQPLALDKHECVARNPSLLRDLPAAITRAIDQAQQRQLERAGRADLELKLQQVTATIQETEHRHQSAMAAAAEQLAKIHSQYEMKMARAAATQDMVKEQFREAAVEVERVRLRHGVLERQLVEAQTALHTSEERAVEERRSVAELFAERQRDFERKISEEIDKRRSVENTLASALSMGTAAEQRHVSAMAAAAVRSRELQAALSAARHEVESKAAHLDAVGKQAVERKAELEEQIRQERAACAALEKEIADAGAALTERQAHFDRERAEAEATRGALTTRLREVEEDRDQARREQQSAAADITRLTDREAELEGGLKEERATRDTLEQEVARAAAALRDEQEQHRAALATSAAELAERQAHFDRERAEAEAKRVGLVAQLREVEEDRDQARREHQSVVADVSRLTDREATLEVQLKEERQTRGAVEQEVASASAALRDEQEQHRASLTTAAAELAERQARFDRERTQVEGERTGLATQLREMEEARDQARREQQSAAADITRLTEREAALEARLKEECDTRDALVQQHREALATSAAELAERQGRFDRERIQAEEERAGLAAQLREVEEARDQARREHESVVGDFTRAAEHAAAERTAAARCQTDLEARVSEANEKIERLQQTIDALRATSIAQAARFDDERQEQDSRLAKVQDVISTLTGERIVLQNTLDRLTREQAAVLATRENEIKQLQLELQKNRADNHRLFQQATLPMFRCTKDGVLTQANRKLTTLVGRRSPDELRGADWAAAVFESPNDLSWLIERCVGSKGKESTETAWRRKDGSRLLVRLSAWASGDLIEVGVEDLTPIRVLNDRLSQAHRMEAVGRFATEVAVTCGGLLGSVHQNAQQLLITDDSNPASRHRGEMLLDEISRAAGLLRQLAAYGDEESRKPAMVELRTVVRDAAPILKRVAGEAVEVQLPAPSAPLNVDAGAERVQRLLVNLAAYGRERMPLGGQLKIELGTIVVDRHFAAKHPNVRLGPHALVTVTESRRATRTDEPLELPDNGPGSSSPGVAVQRMVDLGTLQELVAECGGHLWMTVEPGGDMVVKIRLPLVTSYGEPPRRTFGPRGRVRTLGHWFQH